MKHVISFTYIIYKIVYFNIQSYRIVVLRIYWKTRLLLISTNRLSIRYTGLKTPSRSNYVFRFCYRLLIEKFLQFQGIATFEHNVDSGPRLFPSLRFSLIES